MSTLFSHFFAKINQITPQEHDFTEVLEDIAVKPKTLYFHGKLPKNVSKSSKTVTKQENKTQEKSITKTRTNPKTGRPASVAIVGSRHNTKYGEEVAYNLAYELAKNGVIIVSGLAFGIDTIGHRGCLDAGGVTVAVLGTPIDQIYPRPHEKVARSIIEQDGAIISEYAPRTNEYLNVPLAPGEAGWNGTKWITYEEESKQEDNFFPPAPYQRRRIETKSSFLYRNRLISGLSDIVVVVEAAEKSGSLNTATHALAQGKTVFAVPGNITNPYSQGCNKLIKQGAIPYTEPADILHELFPEDYIKHHQKLKQQSLFGDTDAETKILQAISQGARTGDQIMSLTHLPPEVFNQTATLLEIKGRLHSLGMNTWSLI
ncbi:DNA-processing protein DprA [Candidatus Saccharibacteria bacterium]|nr:DNA-processing protein DprA [Candidatus Saccharibacteria bacterium]